MFKPNLTVIICATELPEAYAVCQSVEQTSGLNCQFLIHDNSKDNYSITKVYNMYAKIAKSDYILFVHQDVEFAGRKWGKKILKRLKDRTTGCIGFAGSVYRPKDYYAGWPINLELSRNNYIQKTRENLVYHAITVPFDEVVVIDGLAIFCRKDILLENPFDEQTITGFHCYDIDFSLTLANKGFRNYVFTDRQHTPFHKSCGSYTAAWAQQSLKITQQKWNNMTPIHCGKISDFCKNDVDRNNMAFIEIIKKYVKPDLAEQMIAKLPFKENTKTPGIKYANVLRSNGYRSWN